MTVSGGRSVGVIARQVRELRSETWANSRKPITPIAEIMSPWSQVHRNIYRISKTLLLAVWGVPNLLKTFLGVCMGMRGGRRNKRSYTHIHTYTKLNVQKVIMGSFCHSSMFREGMGGQTQVIIHPEE